MILKKFPGFGIKQASEPEEKKFSVLIQRRYKPKRMT